jgi:hypothetical protein
LHVAAYLLRRAFGHTSRSVAELLQHTFEWVHWVVGANRLSEKTWNLLEECLPHPAFWQSWDRCQRLRVAVADLFVERELSPVIFTQLTRDDRLFSAVALEMANSGKGRAYLKHVRFIVPDDSLETRARIIQELID